MRYWERTDETHPNLKKKFHMSDIQLYTSGIIKTMLCALSNTGSVVVVMSVYHDER